MTKIGYQDLQDDLQHKWFTGALHTCNSKQHSLNQTERAFVTSLREGWALFGRDFKPTTRQFNWLRQIASEVKTR